MARAAGDPSVSVHQISVPLLTTIAMITTILGCAWYLAGILAGIQTSLAVYQRDLEDHGRRLEILENWRDSHDPH